MVVEYICEICKSIVNGDEHEICTICGWQRDGVLIDGYSNANSTSFETYFEKYKQFCQSIDTINPWLSHKEIANLRILRKYFRQYMIIIYGSKNRLLRFENYLGKHHLNLGVCYAVFKNLKSNNFYYSKWIEKFYSEGYHWSETPGYLSTKKEKINSLQYRLDIINKLIQNEKKIQKEKKIKLSSN